MHDYINEILAAKTARQFRKVMTQLNSLPEPRAILDELVKTTEDNKVEYSALYLINERISSADLREKFPQVYAAVNLLHPQQKIDLCNLILAEIVKENVEENALNKHCLRLGHFVREGVHPDLLSCDNLIRHDKAAKGCGRHALFLFKLDFSASKETCILLAQKMFRLTEFDDSHKVTSILDHIKKRYPELAHSDELVVTATEQRNVAAINWLHDEKQQQQAKQQEQQDLNTISFGQKTKKKKENGAGRQLAALKDSPRNSEGVVVKRGEELILVATSLLNDCSM
jgi:hypothetical protein